MTSLLELNERFMKSAEKPMDLSGRMPIVPLPDGEPVIVGVQKWRVEGPLMDKMFVFRSCAHRDRFVAGLLAHEEAVQHHACVYFDEFTVTVELSTSGIGRPTELDVEYANNCDVLYKDIVLSPT